MPSSQRLPFKLLYLFIFLISFIVGGVVWSLLMSPFMILWYLARWFIHNGTPHTFLPPKTYYFNILSFKSYKYFVKASLSLGIRCLLQDSLVSLFLTSLYSSVLLFKTESCMILFHSLSYFRVLFALVALLCDALRPIPSRRSRGRLLGEPPQQVRPCSTLPNSCRL